MNIAFFIYSLSGGGAERVTCHMAEHWAKSGHDVTVITMADLKNNRYTLTPTIKLKPLATAKQSKNALHAIANNISQIFTLRRELKQLQPDTLIAMMTHANVMASLACIGLPINCIGSERNFPGQDYTGRIWQLLRKHCYRLADTIVVQTEVGKTWIDKNTNAKHTVTIPNPLILPLPSNDPVVTPPTSARCSTRQMIGVGRLNKLKQFDHLIKMFHQLHSQHPDWKLTILGEGQELEKLQAIVKERNLQRHVKLTGRAGNITDWYQHADILAMTSLTEGFPNVLIEAMAHGVAVISYDCPTGPAEIIEDGVNGMLVPLNNIDDYTHRLNQLMSNDELRASLGQAATHIADKLHPDIIMTKWDSLISEKTSTSTLPN